MLLCHGDGRQGLIFLPKIICSSSCMGVMIFGRSGKKKSPNKHNKYIDLEVEVVRTKITLACTECQNRNYNLTKDKKTHPERMETKKYCPFCRKHTLHKETK